jgi:hypothetical protein
MMVRAMVRAPNAKRVACPASPGAHPLVRQFFELLARAGVALADAALGALGWELRVEEIETGLPAARVLATAAANAARAGVELAP